MSKTPPPGSAMLADLQRSGLLPSDMDCTEIIEQFSQQVTGYTIPYYLPDGTQHPFMKRWRNTAVAPGGPRYGQPSADDIGKAGGAPADATYPYLNPHIIGAATWAQIAALPNKLVTLVEGEKKAVCAGKLLQRPFVGIGGCWNGVVRDEKTGAFRLHPAIRALFNPGDRCEVVFDADVMTKPLVNRAAGTLRRAFMREGIPVAFVLLPDLGGAKMGLDDWLLANVANVRVAYDALPRIDGSEGDGFTEDHVSVWDFLGLIMSNERPAPIEQNIKLILEKHERYRDKVWYDVVGQRIWHAFNGRAEQFSDSMAFHECAWMQRQLGLVNVRNSLVLNGFLSVPSVPRLRVNPLHDDIESEPWDGVDRLESMFVRGFGAVDTGYHREIGRNWLVSAIARAYDPGCQVDTMLILEGRQGIGKSQALKIIGGRWYIELKQQIGEKDFILAAHSGWIADIIELGAFKYADFTHIKGEITTRVDSIRAPYGRSIEDRPRRFVLTGTTNTTDYLRDETGNRRFWPVECDAIDLQWLRDNRSQLMAEALVRWKSGQQWWTVDQDMLDETADVQAARMELDPWEEAVYAVLSDPKKYRTINTTNGFRHFVATSEILYALGVETQHQTSGLTRRLTRIMAGITGWQPHRYNTKDKAISLTHGGTTCNARGFTHEVTGLAPTSVVDFPGTTNQRTKF